MSEHTPGPWKAEKHHVIQIGTGDVVTSCFYGFANRDNYAEDYATARLIAAAPDMLEVLKQLAESAEYWSEYDVPVGIVDKINAAIAKAEGKQ